MSPQENHFFFAGSVVLLSYILKFTKSRAKEKALKPLSFKAFSVVGLTEIYSKKLHQTVEKLADLKKCSAPEPISADELTAPQSNSIRKELTRQQRYLTELEVKTAIIEYQQGRSTYELAKKYGCHRRTISDTLKRNGIEISHLASKKPELVKKVIEQYSEMKTPKEVGAIVGINEGTVRQILKEKNIYIRKSWEYPKNR